MQQTPSISTDSPSYRWYRKIPSRLNDHNTWPSANDRPPFISQEVPFHDLIDLENEIIDYGNNITSSWRNIIDGLPYITYQQAISNGLIEDRPYYEVLKEVEKFDKKPALVRFFTGWFYEIPRKRELLTYYAMKQLISREPLKTDVSYWYSLLQKHTPKLSSTLPTLINKFCSMFSNNVTNNHQISQNDISKIQQRGNEFKHQLNAINTIATESLNKNVPKYSKEEDYQQQVSLIKKWRDKLIQPIIDKAAKFFSKQISSNDANNEAATTVALQQIQETRAAGEKQLEWLKNIRIYRKQKREVHVAELLAILNKKTWHLATTIQQQFIDYRNELNQIHSLIKKVFKNCSTDQEWVEVRQQFFPLLGEWVFRSLHSLNLEKLFIENNIIRDYDDKVFEIIDYLLGQHFWTRSDSFDSHLKNLFFPTLNHLTINLGSILDDPSGCYQYCDSDQIRQMLSEENSKFRNLFHAIKRLISSFTNINYENKSIIKTQKLPRFVNNLATLFICFGQILENCNSSKQYQLYKDLIMPLLSKHVHLYLNSLLNIINHLVNTAYSDDSNYTMKDFINNAAFLIDNLRKIFQPSNEYWMLLFTLEAKYSPNNDNEFQNWFYQFKMITDVLIATYITNDDSNESTKIFDDECILTINLFKISTDVRIFNHVIPLRIPHIEKDRAYQFLRAEINHFLALLAVCKYQGLLLMAEGKSVAQVNTSFKEIKKQFHFTFHPDKLAKRKEYELDSSTISKINEVLNSAVAHVFNVLNPQNDSQIEKQSITEEDIDNHLESILIDAHKFSLTHKKKEMQSKEKYRLLIKEELSKRLASILQPYLIFAFQTHDATLQLHFTALQIKATFDIFIKKANDIINQCYPAEPMNPENISAMTTTLNDLCIELSSQNDVLKNCEYLFMRVESNNTLLLKREYEFTSLAKQLMIDCKNCAVEVEHRNYRSLNNINTVPFIKHIGLENTIDKLSELYRNSNILQKQITISMNNITTYYKIFAEFKSKITHVQQKFSSARQLQKEKIQPPKERNKPTPLQIDPTHLTESDTSESDINRPPRLR